MDLTVGVAVQGSIHDQLLLEMLDHQGIAYRVVNREAEGSEYPVVMVPGYSEESYSVARRFCKSEGDILIVDKVLDLGRTLSLLQGAGCGDGNEFELAVNKEEEKLLSSIRAHFFGQHLPLPRKWYWPGMSTMGCVFTHDIDFFEFSPFHKQVLRQSANPVRLIRLCYGSLLRGRDYGWNIPEMAKMEQDYGYRSTFFFQTSYAGRDLLPESVDLLKKGPFELALHGAHSSHNDTGSLRAELDAFRGRTGKAPIGLRYHILKFETPKTWEIESAAGLSYDATFFYNRMFGFRAGTCFPYHPFSSDSSIPILELPTGYMDWTALHKKQGGREQVEAFERARLAVEDHHGVFIANFHNTYMNKDTFPTLHRIFRSLLETAKAKGYWVATAEECARWWNDRTAAQINPRFESGEVICSPSDADVVVEREGKEPETKASALRAA